MSSSSSSSTRKRKRDSKKQGKTKPISIHKELSSNQRAAGSFLSENGWIMYRFRRDDERFFSNDYIQSVMEGETFAGFCGADKVPEGEVIKNERAQRVPRHSGWTPTPKRTTYTEIRKQWSKSNKKKYTLPPASYRTKITNQLWGSISLDKRRHTGKNGKGTTPFRQHDTRMAPFGGAVRNSAITRTLFEEGIESVINRMLTLHMGRAAFKKLKAQCGHETKSTHLATPQVGAMPANSPTWTPDDIDCPTMRGPVKIKTLNAESPQAVQDALDLYLAQEYHRDYVDASCEVGCMTVLVTTACSARIAIIKDSHQSKNGAEFVAEATKDRCSQTYVVIEIPPYSLFLMDSYLFHAGCRYFAEDHQKKQGHQIGATISYRSHHYIVPDQRKPTTLTTGVKMKWF